MGCGSSKSIPVIGPENQPMFKPSDKNMKNILNDNLNGNVDKDPLTTIKEPSKDNVILNDIQDNRNGMSKIDETHSHHEIDEEKPIKIKEPSDGISLRTKSSAKSGSRAMAFEIPAVEPPKDKIVPKSATDSLIQLHPPKKNELRNNSAMLRKAAPAAAITPELLLEKQKVAQERRKEVIRERVKSANLTSVKSAQARQRAVERRNLDQLVDSEIEAASTVGV